MWKQAVYVLFVIVFSCCNTIDRTYKQDFVVFEKDARKNEGSFKPALSQIDKAEIQLFDYLDTKSKIHQTIYINALEGKVPLQEQLKYYKRRYFGQTNSSGDQIIKIEFVFVRCGGQGAWKRIEYTNDKTGCWLSVKYNIDNGKIYDLQL